MTVIFGLFQKTVVSPGIRDWGAELRGLGDRSPPVGSRGGTPVVVWGPTKPSEAENTT